MNSKIQKKPRLSKRKKQEQKNKPKGRGNEKTNKIISEEAQDKLIPTPITEEMQTSYLDYAMSVIVQRALPDVRDGLKPVHRRILYAMWRLGLTSQAKFRKSATVVGECFMKDTLVLSNKGLVPVQEIKVGDRVYTQDGLEKVTKLYRMPPKKLLRVTLQNGSYNIVTPSQKFKVLGEDLKFHWKKANQLTEKDYLVIRSYYPEIKKLVRLRENSEWGSRALNENLAYLLGLLISDGWVSREERGNRIGFYSGSKEVIKRIISILKQEFDYKATLEAKEYKFETKKRGLVKNKGYGVRINKKEINNFLINNFKLDGIKAPTKRIPQQILNSPKEVIFSFISGLVDGDGSIHVNRNVIHYGSISERLISQLMALLQHYQIFGTKSLTRPPKRHYVGRREVLVKHEFYNLEFRGINAVQLASGLNLADKSKGNRVNNLAKKRLKQSQYDIVPYAGGEIFEELSNKHLGAGWYRDLNDNKFRMGIKYPTGCKIRYSKDLKEKPLRRSQIIKWGIKDKLAKINSSLSAFLDHIFENNIYFLQVSSTQEVSAEETYDLQVENDHEFIANGVISHNCLGKYHPHGDIAVYDSLVRMVQDFAMRYPLIAGQGNFGSMDGDGAAAMRYTECKLESISEQLLLDIDKETINFQPNYDGTQKEPTVLPAKLPNLLLNGSLGIAVGMATNIPPHNLVEIVDGACLLIDKPDTDIDELMKVIKGPDFPTGGLIYDINEIKQAYTTGKGSIVTRAKTEIVEAKNGSFDIIVTEIPYQVNKAGILEKIATLVRERRIEGIKDLRDESDREGVRMVIELKKDAYPQKILNRLYTLTQLQESFHVNMLALVDGIQPRVLTLKNILEEYIKHREQVVHRRAKFNLDRACERAHVLEGLKKAIANIDAVIKIIKKSQDREAAKVNLMKRFKFSDRQTDAILEMRLHQLANLERIRIEEELKEKRKLIGELQALLKSPKKILAAIKKELFEIKDKYADERRTKVVASPIGKFSQEDLIPNEPTIIMMTRDGYIKRMSPDIFKTQGRGGKGVVGLTTKEEDVVDRFFTTTTHSDILFFTTRGKVFQLKAYDIPTASRTAKGQALVNFLQITSQEKVSAVLPLAEIQGCKHLVMVTRKGLIKKVAIDAFARVRQSGLIAIKLKENDELEWVKPSSGNDEIMLVTALGQAIRFREIDVREMGRAAAGVRGMKLREGDEVVGMEVIEKDKAKNFQLFVIMENGFGKKSGLGSYKVQGRGGSGIKTAKVTTKTGKIVHAQLVDHKAVSDSEEIKGDMIIISKKGQVIRLPLKSIPSLGRATQGVRLMRFREKEDTVASVTVI